ncbi:MAG: DNA-nicking Smr family endonuclease [Pseudoalteromonas rhizosphaerae]|jgi:DNA-nicking Smr family endonuclease|uniref:DNA endonuclease SmrA n=1 Tax=Pseudoalteromonas neustonica TaxID=1840331 RepID=A0ABY3FDP0_9GAMM|nr:MULTISPECIES: DNA endonuclease SmrA [Pseudoalteromonas]MBB1300689.1 DNA endonuclease SmrA [Pseudoalteromonas sp. SR44-8]MBB1309387.1 DNA endonuclease SmrA [Pseudoalteromonas sp. SR41-8]MBB1332703.1 DNA endonuclease SmrA [Pseudoalteromonas sp. SR41-6]MBB1340442.1 DNA endonuclease SmrA [Pseudoalteromonas sp. SR45-6]MBB1459213.1 DNA endonuclease SmrA [Pseudoalteromonas sp. SG41-8]
MPLTDSDLFLTSMEDVARLDHDTIEPSQHLTGPSLAQQQKRKAAELNLNIDENYLRSELVELLEPNALLSYKNAGVQDAVFKNLRLAKYQLDATLDLHGQTLKNARQALFEFITDCQKRNIRVVVIRHGTGIKNKKTPGVLKSYTNKWLQEIDCVLAFHSALRHHGGSGASYVLIKKSDEKKSENRERHSKR